MTIEHVLIDDDDMLADKNLSCNILRFYDHFVVCITCQRLNLCAIIKWILMRERILKIYVINYDLWIKKQRIEI